MAVDGSGVPRSALGAARRGKTMACCWSNAGRVRSLRMRAARDNLSICTPCLAHVETAGVCVHDQAGREAFCGTAASTPARCVAVRASTPTRDARRPAAENRPPSHSRPAHARILQHIGALVQQLHSSLMPLTTTPQRGNQEVRATQKSVPNFGHSTSASDTGRIGHTKSWRRTGA